MESSTALTPPEMHEHLRGVVELRHTDQPQRYELECVCQGGPRIPIEVFIYLRRSRRTVAPSTIQGW